AAVDVELEPALRVSEREPEQAAAQRIEQLDDEDEGRDDAEDEPGRRTRIPGLPPGEGEPGREAEDGGNRGNEQPAGPLGSKDRHLSSRPAGWTSAGRRP